MKETFVIIDANAIFHRAYHALPRFTTKAGELVNAVYGFGLILVKVLKELKPEYFVAAFDVDGPTFRDKEYKEYKAIGRKAPTKCNLKFHGYRRCSKYLISPSTKNMGLRQTIFWVLWQRN